MAVATTQPAPAESVVERELSPPPPPGYKDVRFVRRELVDLVNNSVSIQAEVAEAEVMLERAVSMYNDVALDFREMACIRRTTEVSFVAMMKKDRTIWDGMFMMENDEDKDAWGNYVKEMKEHRANQKELKEKAEAAKSAAETAAYERERAAASSQPSSEVEITPSRCTGSRRERKMIC